MLNSLLQWNERTRAGALAIKTMAMVFDPEIALLSHYIDINTLLSID